MKTITGVFSSSLQADRARFGLRTLGFAQRQVTLLTPRSSAAQINSTPTADGEQPGMGAIIGALASAGAGLFAAHLLAVWLALPFPGYQFTTLVVMGALGGCVLGALAGSKLEDTFTRGLPRDEFYFYKDELTYGRSVIIVLADRSPQLRHARTNLTKLGADHLNTARRRRWIGVVQYR